MPNWLHLPGNPTPIDLGAALANEAHDLNGQVEEIHARRQALDLLLADPVERHRHRGDVVELLAAERDLRRRIGQHMAAVREAQAKAADKARGDVAQRRQEVVDGLRAIGFDLGSDPFAQALVARHPGVRTLQVRADELASASHDTDAIRDNAAALASLEAHLAAVVCE